MWFSRVIDWLRDLDYGSVPAWLGAGSLLLAYRIFLRDRTSAQRKQVDLLGLWMKPAWELRAPGQELAEEITITRFARNGSDLPIDVVQIAYDVTTRWWVPDSQWTKELEVYAPVGGTGRVQFYAGPIRVAPGETWSDEAEPQKVNIAHLAPERAAALDLTAGVSYEIRWALVSDNAGRRWVVRPGRPTGRVRWYSRRNPSYPRDWQHRLTWALRRFPHWVRERWAQRKASRQARP